MIGDIGQAIGNVVNEGVSGPTPAAGGGAAGVPTPAANSAPVSTAIQPSPPGIQPAPVTGYPPPVTVIYPPMMGGCCCCGACQGQSIAGQAVPADSPGGSSGGTGSGGAAFTAGGPTGSIGQVFGSVLPGTIGAAAMPQSGSGGGGGGGGSSVGDVLATVAAFLGL